MEEVKIKYYFGLARNLMVENELFKIMKYFKESNIPVIPLKGTILSRYLYGDLNFRQPSCDLDLLVQPETIEDVEKTLKANGYVYYCRNSAEFRHRFSNEIEFNKNIKGLNIIIDLHWGFRDRFVKTHLKDFWANARVINVEGKEILFPSNEDLLIYLALVAMSTFDFVDIRYLQDIDALIAKYGKEINWQEAIRRAKEIYAASALFFALRLSNELFNTNISNELLNTIKPGLIKKFLLGIWLDKTNIIRYRQKFASDIFWRHFVSSYLYSDNIIDCARKIFNKVFIPMSETMGYYGQPMSKVSYGLYIKRLLRPIFS